MGFEVFTETCEHRTHSIDEAVSFDTFLELDSTFEIVYLGKERKEEFARKEKCHIRLVTFDTHEEILVVCLGTSESFLKALQLFIIIGSFIFLGIENLFEELIGFRIWSWYWILC